MVGTLPSFRYSRFSHTGHVVLWMAWSQIGIDPAFQEGIDILATTVMAKAGVPTYLPATDPEADEFQKHYHPTLVVLAALAESMLIDCS